MKPPPQQIPTIPPNVAGADLVAILNDRIRRINGLIGTTEVTSTTNNTVVINTPSGSATIAPPSVFGTHQDRLQTATDTYPAGTFFLETDRGVMYQLQPIGGGAVWKYFSGTMAATLANKPSDLSGNDAGFLFRATDYTRVWRWTGAAWTRAPGERPTREFIYAAENPGTGWQLCDGSAGVTYTKDDATTATMTMPNETAGTYRKGGGAYSSTTNAGTTPAISGSTAAVSAGTPAGTIAWPAGVPTFSGNALGTHQHHLPFNFSAFGGAAVWYGGSYGTSGSFGGTASHAASADASTRAQELSEAVSAGTPSGTIAWPAGVPTFSGSALGTHSHGAGTLALASIAEPNNVVMLPYMKL